MDEYAFHLKVWRILHALCSRWIRRKFNMRFEPLRVEGPVLLVPNHVNAWDPLLVAMSLRDKHVYFVASEHLFRLGFLSRVIEKLVAPIPRRKASTGTDTVKACLRHLRALGRAEHPDLPGHGQAGQKLRRDARHLPAGGRLSLQAALGQKRPPRRGVRPPGEGLPARAAQDHEPGGDQRRHRARHL